MTQMVVAPKFHVFKASEELGFLPPTQIIYKSSLFVGPLVTNPYNYSTPKSPSFSRTSCRKQKSLAHAYMYTPRKLTWQWKLPRFNSEQLYIFKRSMLHCPMLVFGWEGGVKHITIIRHHINHRCLTSNHKTHPESLMMEPTK